MTKYLDACCYGFGAFLWPYTAGLMIDEAGGLHSAVLLIFSFIAWWKFARYLKLVR